MAWPSPERVGKQEGNASLWLPIAGTSSGARALGALGLGGRLVHLSRDFSRRILRSHVVVCEGCDSLPQQHSLLCCLCPMIVPGRRAVTHRSPPSPWDVGASLLAGAGASQGQVHASQPFFGQMGSRATACGTWLWQNRGVGMERTILP